MKIILLAILMLTACNQHTKNSHTFWEFDPYHEAEQTNVYQAETICRGYAGNATNLAKHNNLDSISNNLGSELVIAHINKNNIQVAFNNTFKSCMAQNGWHATLKTINYPKLIKCRKKSGELVEVKISPDACLHNKGTIL